MRLRRYISHSTKDMRSMSARAPRISMKVMLTLLDLEYSPILLLTGLSANHKCRRLLTGCKSISKAKFGTEKARQVCLMQVGRCADWGTHSNYLCRSDASIHHKKQRCTVSAWLSECRTQASDNELFPHAPRNAQLRKEHKACGRGTGEGSFVLRLR